MLATVFVHAVGFFNPFNHERVAKPDNYVLQVLKQYLFVSQLGTGNYLTSNNIFLPQAYMVKTELTC